MSYSFAKHLLRYGPSAVLPCFDLSAARSYCARLTRTHYENFSVASALLPRRLAPHFYPIYAFCRWADDLADETGGGAHALKLLAWWREELLRCYSGKPTHPIMIALKPTIERFSIPPKPFLDLLVAFEQDQRVHGYASFDDLLQYCRYSANPVGHLVLYLGESFNEETAELSDHICTALQLANFWQDVARDYKELGRVYLPERDRRDFGYDDEDLIAGRFTPKFRELLHFQVNRTRELFDKGRPLLPLIPADLRIDIELFLEGGLAILRGIEAIDYDVWSRRPEVSKRQKFALLLQALRRKSLSFSMPERRVPTSFAKKLVPAPVASPRHALRTSYRWCRDLTRKTARNFGYSFLVLSRPKRQAMDALYAFMRITDDLADEAGSISEKQSALAHWRLTLESALQGEYSHPLHPALHDVVRRFSIPARYLFAVVDGVESDLEPVRIKTFEELETYCYRVASVVGLCCIHIWGFASARAERYAIANGIALQLTNILRDLNEDRERGRIYLPQTDLQSFNCPPEQWQADCAKFQALMRFQVERAQRYYEEGAKLEPLLTAEGRAVFRTMTGIYRDLLETITDKNFDVFSRRLALSRWQKVRWLLSAFPRRWGWNY